MTARDESDVTAVRRLLAVRREASPNRRLALAIYCLRVRSVPSGGYEATTPHAIGGRGARSTL
jgi:hypothetical protein